jgi:putative phosphoribosyl transferase
MPTRNLPARPDLEQYRKQAKELCKDRATSVSAALDRIRQYHPRFRDLPDFDIQHAAFKLSDAQLTIAREHDFDTWPQFAAHVQNLQPQNSSPGTPGANEFMERVLVGGVELEAFITGVENAKGVVLFTQASGSSRYHPGFRYIAHELNRASICTVLADLLTEEEELADAENEQLQFDVRLLGKRVTVLTDWMVQHPRLKHLAPGYFASGNGSAAAMFAAGERTGLIRAIVSGGGRPDLAGPWLWRVQAPTLFVVGSKDTVAVGFTKSIMAPLLHNMDRKFAVIDGAHHLYEEQDALNKTAALTCGWFRQYLAV